VTASAALTPWLERWGLTFEALPGRGGREIYPGTGEVAFVRRGAEPLVLKLLPEGSDEFRSGEVLTHWNGRGAVRVVDAAPGAILIERAAPGDDLVPLVLSGCDDAATLVLCEVMEQLNRPAPAPARPFRTVADWGKGFARDREVALAVGVDAALIDHAEAVFFDLCASQAEPILLHGDFQHYNVIQGGARGWVAIDPKGILGEPAYETGALLRNPQIDPALVAEPAVISRRIDLIAERLGYPRQRLIGWCYSQWVLSVLWAIEDHLPYAPDWLRGPLAAQSLL
jgi:streptomycin 6-kinase